MLKLYHGALRLATKLLPWGARFNPKLKKWIEGRKNWSSLLKSANLTPGSIWFHAASSGEFEQAIPLIEWLKAHHPQSSFVISFFSPSGFELYQHYPGASAVFYLPVDQPEANVELLELLQPSCAIFIKYELWPGLFQAIIKKGIPLAVVAARFHPNHFLLNYWFKPLLRLITQAVKVVGAQDQLSVETMQKAGFNYIAWCGDTRFDRVHELSQMELPVEFAQVKNVELVAGSTWEKDDVFLSAWLDIAAPETRVLVFPHELTVARLEACLKHYSRHGASIWKGGVWPSSRVVIIGLPKLLSRAYRLGASAWIGGGFDKGGIHNCLEAAVYGIPVFFGPVFQAYPEAIKLVESGGGVPIKTIEALHNRMSSSNILLEMAQSSKNFVQSNLGATERTISLLQNNNFPF